jgi:hypothetical protein
LLLDADETVPEHSALELAKIAAQDSADGVFSKLSYFWRGEPLNHGQRVAKLAFFKASKSTFPRPADLKAPGIGEVEGHYQPRIHGRVIWARGTIVHNDPDPVSSWYDRHNKYSDWEAFVRTHPDVRADIRAHRSRQGQVLDKLPFKPVVVFLYNYVLRCGFLDGRRGFEFAFSLALYQFQIDIKVRELTDPSGEYSSTKDA